MKHAIRTTTLALAAIFWLGFGTPPCAAQENIRLGMSASFSGPLRDLGIELYRGAQAYFDKVNAEGGVHGRMIEILPLDDAYDPERCLANTVTFIQRTQVFALFNYVGTPTTTRILPLLERYSDRDMLLLFPLSGADPLRTPPYVDRVFNLRPSYNDEARALVNHFLDAGRDRIAVFYQADAFGRNGWDGVRRTLAAQHLDIVSEAAYAKGDGFDADMGEQVEIIARNKPQAVICAGTSEACAAFLRDAHARGLTVPIAALSIANLRRVVEFMDSPAEPEAWPGDFIASLATPSPHNLLLPAVREYQRLITDAPLPPQSLMVTPYEPPACSITAFEGFLTAKVLVQALERLGPYPNRQGLARALADPRGVDVGLDAPLVFSPDRHQALTTVHFARINGQRVTPINDFRRWRR